MIARLTPSDVRPTIPDKDMRWLGTIAENDYGEFRGAEYAVDRNPTDDPARYNRRPGEIMVVRRVHEVVDGSKYDHDQYYRAIPVAPGTYAGLAARQEAAKARAARKAAPRLMDLLANHPLLRRQAASYLRVQPESDLSVAGLGSAVRGIVLPAHEQQRGPAAILAVLRGKGIELRLSADKAALVPVADRGQTDGVRLLLEQAAPLLLAHLRGEPLRCQLRHSEKQPPEAMSLLVGGAAACEAHLSGELAP